MKYLIIATNPTSGAIEWNILEYKDRIPEFIKFNYGTLIKRCNYSWKELSRYIVIFEIDPTYEKINLDITKPTEFVIKLEKG